MKKLLFFACLSLFILSACVTRVPPPTPEVSYDPAIEKIMRNYCLTCHSGAAASAGLDLSTYEGVRAATEFGPLSSRINDLSAPMPPSGVMSEDKRQKIQRWIEGGFK